MKKVFLAFLFCFIFCFVSFADEIPTKESLIKAWEEIQKQDPNTTKLEKIQDNQYKFSNKKIPFEGILEIINVEVDTGMMPGDDNYIMGIMEVELVGISDEFIRKNSRRYYSWQSNNNLYYDKKAGKWISLREFQKALTEKQERLFSIFSFFSDYFLIIVLLIFIGFVVYFSRKQKRIFDTSFKQQAEAMDQVKKSLELSEKSVALNEEANKILNDILNALKK